MMSFLSILRRDRRPRPAASPARRRALRSFAASRGWLESRTLLSTLVALVDPTDLAQAAIEIPAQAPTLLTEGLTSASATALVAVPVPAGEPILSTGGFTSASIDASQPVPPPWQPDGAGNSLSVAGPTSVIAGQAKGGPSSSDQDPAGPGLSPARYWVKNHIDLAAVDIQVAGFMTPEFAIADARQSEVFVKVGLGGQVTTLGPAQGIDHPQSVTLADLSGDGNPDLIVANSGANNVLVFPGLPGGLFGPELNGGNGFATGTDPVGITVGDINGDGTPDLIVANKGSDSLTILDGQATRTGWTLVPARTLNIEPPPQAVAVGAPDPPPTAPVKTVLYDLNHDGQLDLFVCNSGSNNVYMYAGEGNGQFDLEDPTIFAVGADPAAMFVGRFDKRPQVDLVTVNSGSNDITFVGGVFMPNPSTTTISSGGIGPDAAFAVDPTRSGVMDLVVANAGDGHLALLRAVNEGMQLAGVITQADIPIPTALAPASWGAGGIDFYAASAGLDAAQLLHFDLGTASNFLSGPIELANPTGDSDQGLFGQLLASDDSSLEFLAVLWSGEPDSLAISDEWGFRESSTVTALYSPTEGQGEDGTSPTSEVASAAPPPDAPASPSGEDSSALARFVFGLDAALGAPGSVVAAVAARDARDVDDERPARELAGLDRPPSSRALERTFDPDVEAAEGSIDEALRLFWSEEPPPTAPAPGAPTTRFDPIREPGEVDAPARDVRVELIPAVSSAVLLSTRLILKASPPRPPKFRRKPGLRPIREIWGAGPGRDRPDRV